METLQLLSIGLGLSALAGINLYLTVFVTGLAIQQHWVVLSPQFQHLNVLAHPAIIAISGVLYFLEFFADKIQVVDSIWDFVHTVIRPIGGAFLAVHALGETSQIMEVIAALLGGSVALTTHAAKAGTRIIANTSPEPVSNILLSGGEDVAVVGGLALLYAHPLIALVAVLLVLTAIYYFAPKLVRAINVNIWLIRQKLKMWILKIIPFKKTVPKPLATELPAVANPLFARLNATHAEIEWTAECLSARSRQMPANVFGHLVATREEPHKLYFVAKRWIGSVAKILDLRGYHITHESRVFSEWLILDSLDKRPKLAFFFDCGSAARVAQIAESLANRLQPSSAANTSTDNNRNQVEGTLAQTTT